MGQIYQYRNLARIIIETKTPLAVGSGEKDMITDQIVIRDVNGLPYIPGTSIAGIIRHAMNIGKHDKSIFGFNESKEKRKDKENTDEGSQIIFSSAQIVDEDGKIVEGLINEKSDYLKKFSKLPIRQHVKINEKGVSEKRGKFDEEVVYKGVRFCFEIELLSAEKNNSNFQKVLNELANDTIRIGSGTRKGFGEVSVVECKIKTLDFSKSDELNIYIEKTSSLNDTFWDSISNTTPKPNADGWVTYELDLKPDDFFLFGSGFGNEDADMIPVRETYFDWSSGKPVAREKAVLIPGSSIKGAISHRVAFHYNRIKKFFAGNPEAKTGVENLAVQTLFGYTRKVKDENGKEKEELQRGNVLISDVIQMQDNEQNKILNHVSIDRFTGGAMDGALFSENVIYGSKEKSYVLTFKVNNDALKNIDVEQSFEQSLFDIAEGMLPLGGGINRGHGCFSGKVYKNSEEIKR
jgi:CRISPR/Cas system CSM-associated protein Csm3 (group 7 of RAMP superfamily)